MTSIARSFDFLFPLDDARLIVLSINIKTQILSTFYTFTKRVDSHMFITTFFLTI